ncbi:alpha/beta hydrolase [Flavihumibacter rivuli]|uniref:alpha/beta fold hydrolase n=1 Tax=Flavihumibacter rivuli TaxID=2838156 RepID=UPI001BDED2D4|nr:alpha/beta hydrolase [Flavihumibacter rivuli]ULQ55191.1 alpha/beta hydrolase [Flavihumibacter rivuli]
MKQIILFLTTILIAGFSQGQDSSFSFLTSDSVSLYVRIAGKGAPCLFVHGGPGSTSNYFEAVDASRLMEQHYRMIYFDQRGSGRSGSASNGDYSTGRVLKDMEELRQALNIRQWTVMGHSFAGLIVTPYAYQYPKSISALILLHGTLDLKASINSHISNGKMLLQQEKRSFSIPDTLPMMEQLSAVHNKLHEEGIWYKLMFRSQREKDINDSVTAIIGNPNREFSNKVWGYPEYWEDLTVITPRIECPVLVITGSRDYAIGPEQYTRFLFPRKKISVYQGGHASYQEDPKWFFYQVMAFRKQYPMD